MAIVFILSGYLFQTTKIPSPKLFSSTIIVFLLLLITSYFGLNNSINYVLMAENRYGNYIFFFTSATTGILTSIIISKMIEKFIPSFSKLMQKIGSDTLLIFILHKYPLEWLTSYLLLIEATDIPTWIITPISLLFTILISFPTSNLIKKYLPILAGQ